MESTHTAKQPVSKVVDSATSESKRMEREDWNTDAPDNQRDTEISANSFSALEPDQSAEHAKKRRDMADRAMGVSVSGFGPTHHAGFMDPNALFASKPGANDFDLFNTKDAGGFPTAKIEPKPMVGAQISSQQVTTIPKELLGEYFRPNVVLIRSELGTAAAAARKVFQRCQKSIKALDNSFATVDESKYRLRGNVEFGYEATKFELQVLRVEIANVTQLAVDVKHTTYTGRAAFDMLVQRLAWDLSQENLAITMADGTDILRPMSEILAQLERDEDLGFTTDDDDDDLLAPPSMLGLSSVVTNRKTGKKRSNGIRLDNDESDELVKIWGNMLQSRERHEILKTIAHCSENEKNAEVLGTSTDFMERIVNVLESVGHSGEKDQQSVHCAMAIICNVLMVRAALEFLVKTKIVEVLVENLYYFSGILAKTSACRSTSIQDATVEALVALVEYQDGRDFVVTAGTRSKLENVLLNQRKIRSQKSQEGLRIVCNALKL